ncbi:GD24966 [Drosophila simulans]|uniref:GD24966 n=1 Tax=Drosophila simulans TaxID=7240 RepID=B4QBW7_DROSI|nr:GD24966 [Drosophila simulans]
MVSRRSSSSSACLDVQTQNARESCAKKAKKPERREQEATATPAPAPTEAATEAAATPAAAEAAAAPKERRRPQRSPEDGPKSPPRTHTSSQRPKNGKTERCTGAPTSGYPLRSLAAEDAAYLQALLTQ